MKYVLFAVLFSMLSFYSIAQNVTTTIQFTNTAESVNDSIIYYNPQKSLVWDDFKGDPDYTNPHAASTNSAFGYRSSVHRTKDSLTLVIQVHCEFNKYKSWVKPNKNTDYILHHEQHHFDIAYLNTLLFIKKLQAAVFTTDNCKSLVTELSKDAHTASTNMQHQYDEETNHGLIKDKQQEWAEKIALWIQQNEGVIKAL